MYEAPLRCTAAKVYNLMREQSELHTIRYHANNPDRNRHQTTARSLVRPSDPNNRSLSRNPQRARFHQ